VLPDGEGLRGASRRYRVSGVHPLNIVCAGSWLRRDEGNTSSIPPSRTVQPRSHPIRSHPAPAKHVTLTVAADQPSSSPAPNPAAAAHRVTAALASVGTLVRRPLRAAAERRTVARGRRQLVAWASDDLRTPLIGLQAMIDAVAAGAVREPEELRRCHQRMLHEIGHLSDLLDDLAVLGGAKPAEGPTARNVGAETVFELAYRDQADHRGYDRSRAAG
jgi:signal transduction histidine kinase